MSRIICYVAHPLGDNVPHNAERCVRWIDWLMERHDDVSFCCPWLPFVQVYNLRFAKSGIPEKDHPFRQRCLRDDVAIASVCHGIVLVGGRVTPGMMLERDEVLLRGGWVSDLTKLGDEPSTADVILGMSDHGLTPLEYGRRYYQLLKAPCATD